MTTVNTSRVSMIKTTRKITKDLSRLALMGSVALPSSFAMGLGIVAAPVMFAPSAEAAVILGNRNKIKQKPRRNYKSTVRIDRDLFDANVEVSVNGQVKFFAPDGTSGPVIDLNLVPSKNSTLPAENPIFERIADAANNIIAASVEGGTCGGTEVNIEVPFESKSPVTFTLCDNGENTVEGKAWFTNAGKLRATFAVPFDKAARSDLYGRILIKGQPLEMERTVYTGNVNEVEPGALTGFTYEQTINVVDVFGKTLDSQTVRGIVGEDDVEVMGPAHVIIGNRNRLKEKPRRNYKSVGVSQDNSGGDAGTGTATVTVTANFEIIYTAADGQNTAPPIPPITLTEPARANIALTYGDGPNAGDTLFGGYCGGSFAVPVGGVDDENDIIIDDMGGTSIEGTELAIRANARLDGSLRVRIKGDYSAIENCEADSLFAENTGPLSGSFVNYIWEGDIDVDPRSFDSDQYERITTLTDENGKLLDSFTDLVVLNAPETTATQRATGYAIIGNRNKLKRKPRRNYQGKTVSNGGGEGVTTWAKIAVSYVGVEDRGPLRTVPTTTITTPLNSTYLYEVDGNGEGVLQPDAWCGYDIGPITLGEDTQIGDQGVTASMSERDNGNYRIKFKGAGEAFVEQCVGQNELVVNGELAYDLGAQHVWTADLEGVPTDLPEDTVFDFTSTLINADTGKTLARSRQMLTANDAVREGPKITVVDFDEAEDSLGSAETIYDTTVVTEGLSRVSRVEPGKDGTLTVNVCHLFTAPEVTFADPDSVLDMKYLLEITTSDETGEENGYLEYLVTGEDGPSGNAGEQVNGDAFEVDAVLLQNDDMETYEVSVSLCGAPKNVSEAVIFMTPQDGGSDAEPEDFTLEFVDKISITDSKIPARKEQNTFVFGTYVYAEACTISGDNGDIRDPNDIRPIWCEVDASFSPEGSTLPIDVWECQATFISEDSGTIGACKNGLTRLAAQTGQAGIDYISSLLRGKVKGPRKKYYRAERRRRARA